MERKYFDAILGDGSRITITVNQEQGGAWRATLAGKTQSDSDTGKTALESAFRMAANLMPFDSLDVQEVVPFRTVSRHQLLTMRDEIVKALR